MSEPKPDSAVDQPRVAKPSATTADPSIADRLKELLKLRFPSCGPPTPTALADATRWMQQALEFGDDPRQARALAGGGVFVRCYHGEGSDIVSDTEFTAEKNGSRFYRLSSNLRPGAARFLGLLVPSL